ncbi:hypothetical protein GCM10010392_66110 [Streptomyces clavifer]|nr:hypothetical protein GCM10010392_66110 [Streptomyces clavifer]
MSQRPGLVPVSSWKRRAKVRALIRAPGQVRERQGFVEALQGPHWNRALHTETDPVQRRRHHLARAVNSAGVGADGRRAEGECGGRVGDDGGRDVQRVDQMAEAGHSRDGKYAGEEQTAECRQPAASTHAVAVSAHIAAAGRSRGALHRTSVGATSALLGDLSINHPGRYVLRRVIHRS